jgi:chromosome segregation ATPase
MMLSSLQALRAEHEAFVADQSREAEAAYESHQAANGELHRTINALQAQLDESSGSAHAALRSTRAQLEASNAKLRLVEDEVQTLLDAKEELRTQLEHTTLDYEREVDDLRSRVRVLEMERASAVSRADSAEATAAQLQATNVQISARAAAQANELTRIQNTTATTQKAFEDELRSLIKQHEVLKNENSELRRGEGGGGLRGDASRTSLLSGTGLLAREDKHRAIALENELAACREECNEWKRKAEAAENQLKQKRQALQTLSRRSSRSDLHIPSVTAASPLFSATSNPFAETRPRGFAQTTQSAVQQLDDGAAGGEYDIDQALTIASRCQAESDVLRASNNELRSQNNDLKTQIQKAQHAVSEFQTKKEHAEQQVQELSIRVRVLETENMAFRELQEGEGRREKQLAAKTEEQRKEFEGMLEQVRKQMVEQVRAQQNEATKALRELNSKKEGYKKALLASRSKAEAYKDKLMSLYKLYNEVKAKLAEAIHAQEVTSSSRTAELSAASRQVKELMRERELFYVGRDGARPSDAFIASASTVTSMS